MTWNLSKTMYKEVAQTLLEAKKNARAVENATGSLQALSEGSTHEELRKIENAATEMSRNINILYNQIAPKAFGKEAD